MKTSNLMTRPSSFVLIKRLDCHLILILVVLFVDRMVEILPVWESPVRNWIFVLLCGGTACLVASVGSISLYLVVSRVCRRVLYGGWWFALGDAFSDLPAQLAWALGVFLLCLMVASLEAVGRVSLVSLVLLLALSTSGNLPSKYGSGLSRDATLEQRLEVVESRFRLLSGFIQVISRAEKEQLLAAERLQARALLSELGDLDMPGFVEAYYWCLQERIPCSGPRALLKRRGGVFPSPKLSLYDCSRYASFGLDLLGQHTGLGSLVLGAKGSPCFEFMKLDRYLHLFPDVEDLYVAEPTAEFIEGIPRSLSSLSLRIKEANEAILSAVSTHPKLRKFSISTMKMSAGGFRKAIANLKDLEYLELRGQGIVSELLMGLELNLPEGLVLGPGNAVDLYGLRGLKGSSIGSLEIHSDSLKEETVRSVVAGWKGSPSKLSIVPLREQEKYPRVYPQKCARHL